MLSVAESAHILDVSPARVRALIAKGILPARKVGRAWVLTDEDVMQRVGCHPRSGRPRASTKAPANGEAATNHPRPSMHNLYLTCKKELASSPSVAELATIEDPEEVAFRIAVADFFLQRKQSELVRQGVF